MNLTGRLNQSSLMFSAFWSARDARERSMLAMAALVVALALAYAVLINPALGGREQLNRSLPLLRQQVAQMRAMSNQAAALSEKPAAPSMPMSRENIEAALARSGLKAQSVILSGDFAKVQLSAVSFANTLYWLDDMQKTAKLSATDANIVALSQPDTINATFTLHQAAHE
ncbi:MAG: type II secretion system protein GspM [Gallionella sp.]